MAERGGESQRRSGGSSRSSSRGGDRSRHDDLESLLDRGAQADRARRVAGVGPSFPITGYDGLTAAQVQDRLGTLNAAELRKLCDHECRHAHRKPVLAPIESKLS